MLQLILSFILYVLTFQVFTLWGNCKRFPKKDEQVYEKRNFVLCHQRKCEPLPASSGHSTCTGRYLKYMYIKLKNTDQILNQAMLTL